MASNASSIADVESMGSSCEGLGGAFGAVVGSSKYSSSRKELASSERKRSGSMQAAESYKDYMIINDNVLI